MNIIEVNKMVKEYKKTLTSELAKRDALLSRQFDVSFLEDMIKECNMNPNLVCTVTLSDGTRIDLKTVKDEKPKNPLFTEQAYYEE